MATTILTVGHSNHTETNFLEILKKNNVTAIADVRSFPKSRAAPWSNDRNLKPWLKSHGIAYSFLGLELGGRPTDKGLFRNGIADYNAMERTPLFRRGIERILGGSKVYRIALMCSERDPLECHRCLLIGRHLHTRSMSVEHILFNGTIETHKETESRLLSVRGQMNDQTDLLAGHEELLSLAYQAQMTDFAYNEA